MSKLQAPGVSPGTRVVLRSSPIGAKDSVTVSPLPPLSFHHRKSPGRTLQCGVIATPGGGGGQPGGPVSLSDPAPSGRKIPLLYRASGALLPSTKRHRAEARAYVLSPLRC